MYKGQPNVQYVSLEDEVMWQGIPVKSSLD